MSRSEITLELTGLLARAGSRNEVRFPAEGSLQIGDVLAQLVREFPVTAEILGSETRLTAEDGNLPSGLMIIRDGSVLPFRLETMVSPGDRLMVMPLISGG